VKRQLDEIGWSITMIGSETDAKGKSFGIYFEANGHTVGD
jgi:hypothetical protein